MAMTANSDPFPPVAGSWEVELSETCERLVSELLASPAASPQRADCWRSLFSHIAPYLESWCRGSAVLRRAGLRSEDDWRAVFVRAVERIVRHQFANLQAYVDHCAKRRTEGTLGNTPLEAWLRQLVRYAAGDEVSRFLSVKRIEPAGGARTLEELADGQRTPDRSLLTDLDIRQRSIPIQRAIRELGEDQRAALAQRLGGASYDDIAAALATTSEAARHLVRAAKASLRRSLRRVTQEVQP
jgi:DNA-directed RNA polymerase specialized sigma24 family protein